MATIAGEYQLLTWNLGKLHEVETFQLALEKLRKEVAPMPVVGLQEVKEWASRAVGRHEFLTCDESDCGILIPRSYSAQIRMRSGKRNW